MALRTMTDDERDLLASDPEFAKKCRQAIENYAAYWSIHDGSGLSGSALIKWVKDRLNSVVIEINGVQDQTYAVKCAKKLKGMQFDLAAAPLDSATLIEAIYNYNGNNRFEELASLYFDIIGENINFSTTGN